jgi:hypothetical protein
MHTYEHLGWRTPFVVLAVSTQATLGLATSGLWLLLDTSTPSFEVAALLASGLSAAFGAFVISAVAVCLWTYRACANGHALAVAGDWVVPTASPARAVGNYFIPFANFVLPYRAMREIDTATLGEPSTDPNLGLWWGTWIAGNILSNISFRMDLPGIAFASDLLHLVSAITLALSVQRMDAAQRRRDEELRLSVAPSTATFRDAPERKLPTSS